MEKGPEMSTRRKRFGEILIEQGVLTEVSLRDALNRQKETGKPMGRVLEEMGIITEKEIAGILAKQFGYRTVFDIARHTFPESLLKLLEGEAALKHLIFPLKVEQRTLFLAMANPMDMQLIDKTSFRTGLRVVPCVTTPTEIQEAVSQHYFCTIPAEAGKPDWWTILVVDDQDLVRSAIVAALKKKGYTLFEAVNGAEGLRTALQQQLHLIISDTVMPRMDGEEMFRALKSNPATREIPVIALSSKAAAEEEARLLDMGYFDFIPKPINPIRLTARVNRALRIVFGDHPPK